MAFSCVSSHKDNELSEDRISGYIVIYGNEPFTYPVLKVFNEDESETIFNIKDPASQLYEMQGFLLECSVNYIDESIIEIKSWKIVQ